MIIKLNDGTSFSIEYCIEKISKGFSTLKFEILGDYSASLVQEKILLQGEDITYTLIDSNSKEREFREYTEINNIESYYSEDDLTKTNTVVEVKKV